MSEFSDRPFVAGSLIGLRAFGVDQFGRLHGPSYKQVFRPGENVAECRKSEDPGGWMTFALPMPRLSAWYDPAPLRYHLTGTGLSVEAPSVAELTAADNRRPVEDVWDEAHETHARITEREARKQRHVIGALDCTCGFYAYFDGGNDYKNHDRVSALVEGYGVCTVGLRGFRAEKARLVGLITPKRLNPTLWAYVQRNYPEVQVFDRKRDALDAHPLTPPDPPSPSEPDFWTREVVSR